MSVSVRDVSSCGFICDVTRRWMGPVKSRQAGFFTRFSKLNSRCYKRHRSVNRERLPLQIELKVQSVNSNHEVDILYRCVFAVRSCAGLKAKKPRLLFPFKLC